MEVKHLVIPDFTKIFLSFADKLDHRIRAIEERQIQYINTANNNFKKLKTILVSELNYQDFTIFSENEEFKLPPLESLVDELRLVLSQTLVVGNTAIETTPFEIATHQIPGTTLNEETNSRNSKSPNASFISNSSSANHMRKESKTMNYEMNKEDIMLFYPQQLSHRSGDTSLNISVNGQEDDPESVMQRRKDFVEKVFSPVDDTDRELSDELFQMNTNVEDVLWKEAEPVPPEKGSNQVKVEVTLVEEVVNQIEEELGADGNVEIKQMKSRTPSFGQIEIFEQIKPSTPTQVQSLELEHQLKFGGPLNDSFGDTSIERKGSEHILQTEESIDDNRINNIEGSPAFKNIASSPIHEDSKSKIPLLVKPKRSSTFQPNINPTPKLNLSAILNSKAKPAQSIPGFKKAHTKSVDKFGNNSKKEELKKDDSFTRHFTAKRSSVASKSSSKSLTCDSGSNKSLVKQRTLETEKNRSQRPRKQSQKSPSVSMNRPTIRSDLFTPIRSANIVPTIGSSKDESKEETIKTNTSLQSSSKKNKPNPFFSNYTSQDSLIKSLNDADETEKPEQSESFSNLDSIPGQAQELICEYMNERLPNFMFVNKKMFKGFLSCKIDSYENKMEVLQKQLKDNMAELSKVKDSKRFKLSDGSKKDYLEFSQKKEWDRLIECCSTQQLSPKDIVILRLYFAFLGRDWNQSTSSHFIKQCHKFLVENKAKLNRIMDSELSFEFNERNKDTVRELLIGFKSENFPNNEVSNLRIFDVFTNILIEAMQFAKLIPNSLETEIEEVSNAIENYESIKKNLVEFASRIK